MKKYFLWTCVHFLSTRIPNPVICNCTFSGSHPTLDSLIYPNRLTIKSSPIGWLGKPLKNVQKCNDRPHHLPPTSSCINRKYNNNESMSPNNRLQLSPGDLSLLPRSLAKQQFWPKSSWQMEGGAGAVWRGLLDVPAAIQSPQSAPQGRFRVIFHPKKLWQELLRVPLRLELKQNNSATQKPRGWDARDLLLMCQQGNICHMHLCCFCAIKAWNNLKGPPYFGDKLKKDEIFLH